jgi:hypothetical protein
MIELIQNIFAEGDYIKIFFNNSNKSIEGYIFKLLPSSIAIKTQDGKICGVKGEDIDFFEEGAISAVSEDMKPINQENKVSRRFKTIVSRLEKFIEKCKNHKNLCDFQLKTIEDGIIFAKKG